ncbi:unnamed protein product [Closterium sp. NIES-65]|nr:unnamed protein product [Closterium sp. NIES-65]
MIYVRCERPTYTSSLPSIYSMPDSIFCSYGMRLEQLRLQLSSKKSLLAHANAVVSSMDVMGGWSLLLDRMGLEHLRLQLSSKKSLLAHANAVVSSMDVMGGWSLLLDRMGLEHLRLQLSSKKSLLAHANAVLAMRRAALAHGGAARAGGAALGGVSVAAPLFPPPLFPSSTTAGHAESSIGARRSSKGGWSSHGVHSFNCLPSSDAHIPLIPPLELAAAIGCLIRLLELLSKYLSFPLLHIAAFAASSSKVWHRQSYWSLAPPTNPSFLSSSFACNSLFGSWAGIPPSPLQDEAGNPIYFSHASSANQQLPPGEIKQVRRGLRLLRRSAACLAATHAGRFGIARPGDEVRGGGGAELDEFAELAMMMSAAMRDTRLPFLRHVTRRSRSFLPFFPPNSTTTQPPHLKPLHPALSRHYPPDPLPVPPSSKHFLSLQQPQL